MLVQSGSWLLLWPTLACNATANYRVPALLQEGVGNIAINDAFMLEGAIYFLLKKHFRKESYYVDLLELFHDVRYMAPHLSNLEAALTSMSSGVDNLPN